MESEEQPCVESNHRRTQKVSVKKMTQEKATRLEMDDARNAQVGDNRAYVVVGVVILAAVLALGLALFARSAEAALCRPELNPNCQPGDPPDPPADPYYAPEDGGFAWVMKQRFSGQLSYYDQNFKNFVQAQAGFRVEFEGCASEHDRYNTSGDYQREVFGDTNFTYVWSFPGSKEPPTTFEARDCRVSSYYMQEGTYPVTLTIKDATGKTLDTFTKTITVKDKLIVAIGDSYGAGEGSPDRPRTYDWKGNVETEAHWGDRQCHRSSYAGSTQAAKQLEYEDSHSSVTYVSVACSGATILRQDEKGYSGLLGSYEGREPDAGTTLPPQIQQVQDIVGNRQIDSLIVTAGGNDVYFADIIKHCAKSISCYDQYDTPWFSDFDFSNFNSTMASLAAEDGTYDQLADAIDTKLNVENVYLTEYPSPLTDEEGKLCDADENFQTSTLLWGITEHETQWISDKFVNPLNRNIKDAVDLQKAKGRPWHFVGRLPDDVGGIPGISDEFFRHGFCAAHDQNWVHTAYEAAFIQGPLWNRFTPTPWELADTFGIMHPTLYGYDVYKRHIYSAISGTSSLGPTFVASEPEYAPDRVVVRVTATDPSGIAQDSVSVNATGACQVEGITCTTRRPDGQSLEWTIEVTKEGVHVFDFAAKDGDGQANFFVHEVEFLPPPPPIISGLKDNSYDTDGSLAFFGTAEAGSKIGLFEEGNPQAVGSATTDGSGAWSLTLSGVGNGPHTYTAKATNASGLTSVASQPVRVSVDTQAPKVTSTVPAANATGVKRNTNLTATFSEKMDPSTLTNSTFQLFKVNADGSTTQVTNVTLTPSTDGLKATLNPFGTSTTLLAKSTKYKAVVSTGAKDVAGNLLDQNPTTSGNQQMAWSFKTGSQ